ncbi:MAG: hypothetical protein IT196_01315 [Acidimicrobiales bacterium]|nr:hypothetical protein [Acidimicrobiales bacterium]
MKEAMTLDELRKGLDELDLENTLSAHDVDADQIRGALDLGDIDAAKAAIKEVLGALQAISFGGFPVGEEIDLADLVGFD